MSRSVKVAPSGSPQVRPQKEPVRAAYFNLPLRITTGLIVAILCLSGCEDTQQIREQARQEGFAAGEEAGKAEGHAAGLTEGHKAGFSEGELMGQYEGYVLGTGTILYDNWLPSLAIALVFAGVLIVGGAIYHFTRVLLFPPFLGIVGCMARGMRGIWEVRQANSELNRQRRAAKTEFSTIKLREKIHTALNKASTIYQVNLSVIDEDQKKMFEKVFADLSDAVNVTRRNERAAYDKEYSLMYDLITTEKSLSAAAKAELQKELLALYLERLKKTRS